MSNMTALLVVFLLPSHIISRGFILFWGYLIWLIQLLKGFNPAPTFVCFFLIIMIRRNLGFANNKHYFVWLILPPHSVINTMLNVSAAEFHDARAFLFIGWRHYRPHAHCHWTGTCALNVKNRLYLLIGLTDDIISESLRHLAGSVLGSLQGMIQVALGGGGYHCRNKRSDSSCCLHAKQDKRQDISPITLLLGGEMRQVNTKHKIICLTVNQLLQIKVLMHQSAAQFVKNLYTLKFVVELGEQGKQITWKQTVGDINCHKQTDCLLSQSSMLMPPSDCEVE